MSASKSRGSMVLGDGFAGSDDDSTRLRSAQDASTSNDNANALNSMYFTPV